VPDGTVSPPLSIMAPGRVAFLLREEVMLLLSSEDFSG
jgi:hypothetical protein